MMVDLHTDVADLEAKENQLDKLISDCQQDLKELTEPLRKSSVNKYPFKTQLHGITSCLPTYFKTNNVSWKGVYETKFLYLFLLQNLFKMKT